MKNFELNRDKVLDKAIMDCYREMYAKSQPSADWDQLVKDAEDGKISKDEKIYEHHYLSQEEYQYIVDKYLDGYAIRSDWKDYVGIVEDYLKKGGTKDKWIKEHTDEDGHWHPGYRGYEKVPKLEEQFAKYLNEYVTNDNQVAQDLVNIVMKTIEECKNFYRMNRDESSFRMTCALGASPTSNPETVKKYWKEKTGEDIQIEERNPKLFWYLDKGYTDEDLAYEFEDLGPDWKEKLKKEWADELEKRKQKAQERLKRLEEEIAKNKKEEDDKRESVEA